MYRSVLTMLLCFRCNPKIIATRSLKRGHKKRFKTIIFTNAKSYYQSTVADLKAKVDKKNNA